MTKIILSIILVTSFSLFGMGFSSPEGISAFDDPYIVSGFFLLVFSGLASVGLIDLVNK
ncbi:MAG: hypothetical protein O3C43_12680 [Verrucomicrobia bacterium]|nr:hypothetical protein [Verrucomicrobiota bacterium]MDA1067349.1 hypothetical protein [Verrucomicrobiota bacterium]